MSSYMSHLKNPTILTELESISVNDLLPERPAIIGEFSPAYEAFRVATLSDLAPVTQYEFLQAQQLVDLNWSILQLKASSDVELSTSMERNMGRLIDNKLEGNAESESRRQLNEYLEAGGDEDEFEDNVNWDGMDAQRDGIVERLKASDLDLRGQAFVEANALGVDPRLVLSAQLLKNVNYRRHIDKLPDLERRARLLSAEYREIQKARPIEVVSVSGS
jgi:N12 class adenine-specific DNA methylase